LGNFGQSNSIFLQNNMPCCFLSKCIATFFSGVLLYCMQDQVGRAATEEALAVALSQLQQHQAEAQAHQVLPLLLLHHCTDPVQKLHST